MNQTYTSCWGGRPTIDSWTLAPGVSPSPRYQQAAVFVGARLHVTEGVLKGGREVDGEGAVAVLDTTAGVWLDTHGRVTS
nr:serine/threonine-protein phosphatase BSL1-like isoform X1 [Tanacetum cinerariifolium]GEZ49378.1 serine/threonine-protein phosphatase BSL1-like isoform X1 [Tanacetum cinerariifolium]